MINHYLKRILLCFSLAYISPIVVAQDNLSQALAPTLSVSGEMTTDKFTQLISQGFKTVIVNRPDQEVGNLVSVSQLRDIAEKKRIGVIYQPVKSGNINQTDIKEFAQYYNELPKPILMVCKTGARSASLYAQAKKQGLLNE
ncbi:hypothetical protein B9T31_13800 [Acinetobacter sp. ANC 4558]|uniref:beta-lactamase hydrolase domain-containing protein n=1 Tax=Acinetobacter sp. ANC 4558 TaxID=1977876 RepID=UPI000A353C32|nr:sulfur transferase domain-containing protein [Acinetobacter sp. ANC 4558]OTG83160.1 hypothetical protein B9T31_13800 [Acinetobacter sp. ANC 4558]